MTRPIAKRADGRPAYQDAPKRITSSMVREAGSYQAVVQQRGQGAAV